MNARTVNAIANARAQAQLEARRGQCPAEIPAALYQLELYASMPANATADLVVALQRAAAEITALAARSVVARGDDGSASPAAAGGHAAAAEGMSDQPRPSADRPARGTRVGPRNGSSFPGATS